MRSILTAADHEAYSSPRPKTVRIASPPVPTSPTESISYFPKAPSIAFGAHRGSPPPESYDSASSDDSTSNPFNPDSSASNHDDGDLEVASPTRQNATSSGISSDSHDGRAMGSGNGTSWNTSDLQRAVPIEPNYPSNAEARSSGKPKAALDVDAFTRLLLTGDPGKQPETTTRPHFDSGLASDNSSISNAGTTPGSRPSTEPRLGAAVNAPRTSHETSTSEAEEMRPDSHRQSISGEKKAKPPPPKTRHGKLINPNSSTPTTQTAEAPPSSRASHRQSSPSETSGSLFSEPRHAVPSPPSAKSSTVSDDAGTTESSSLKRAPSQSKRPPTPPLTRRHSQMKNSSKAALRDRPRQISLPSGGPGSQAAGPMSPGLKTPPPPPSRRHDRPLSTLHSEASSQLKSPLSQDPSTPSSLPATEDSGIGVASPPSRNPSVKRTPSGSTTNGSSMPPPPPPPRRIRASSKSSTGSGNPTTVQPDREEERGDDMLPRPSNAEDILADLSRLQKEVDDLRGRYESRLASH